MKRAVAFLAATFLIAGTVYPQVHIHENVSISPGHVYKTQVAWPAGLFLFCSSTITVTITNGYDDLVDPVSDMDLVLVSPTSMTVMTDALHNFNKSWTSPGFDAGSIVTFAIIEHHSCTGLVDTVKVNPVYYQQSSPFDRSFSFQVEGAPSRCNITENPGWSGLYFNVTINTTLKDAIVMEPGVINFGMYWWNSDGSASANKGRLEVTGPCPSQLDAFYYGTSGVITGKVRDSVGVAGTYSFAPSILDADTTKGTNAVYFMAIDTGGGTWVFGDGSIDAGNSKGTWDPLALWPQMSYSTPYSSKFALSISTSDGNPYSHGGLAFFNLSDVYDCSTTLWSLVDTMTLKIISGSRYALLDYIDPVTLNETQDSVIETTGEDIQDGWCALVADGVLPDSASWIVVEAEGDGQTSLDSIEIFPPDVVVSVEPREISPGDTASIVLKRRETDGTLVDYSPWQTFEIGFVSGDKYGTILSSGDTAQYFINASQPFEFIAADSMDADSETVEIRVGPVPSMPSSAHRGAQDKTGQSERAVKGELRRDVSSAVGKNSSAKQQTTAKGRKLVRSTDDFVYNDDYGIGYVTIKEKYSLHIVDHNPWSIWPDLPSTHSGITRGGDLRGYDHKRGFRILVSDARGEPVPGASVVIRHDYQIGTGGHVHDASGDLAPRQEFQGTFYGQGNASGPNGELELVTDANGTAVVDSLVASEISGVYLITAYLVSDPSVKDTVSLNVRVPGLVNFRDLIFLPRAEEPYTFSQTPEYGPNHKENDWCQRVMGNNFFLGILDFNFWSTAKKGGGAPLKVSINDMSLPWGGAFDYKGTWNVINEHAYHRVGLSVDVNRNGMSDAEIRILSNFMKVYSGIRNPEEPIHYGFFNGGN